MSIACCLSLLCQDPYFTVHSRCNCLHFSVELRQVCSKREVKLKGKESRELLFKQEEESGSAAKKPKLDPVREPGTSGVSSISKTVKGKAISNVMLNSKRQSSVPSFLHVDYACSCTRSDVVKDCETPFSLNYAHLLKSGRSSVVTCCYLQNILQIAYTLIHSSNCHVSFI